MFREKLKSIIRENKIQFEEVEHTYTVEGRVMPSVTQIMEDVSKHYYDNEFAQRALKSASERGKEVHRMIELYEEQGIEPEKDYKYYPYLLQYKKAKKIEGFEILVNELMLANDYMAGTIDALGVLDGKLVIIDFKITSKINVDLLELQLQGYKELCAYYGLDIEECFVLHLTKNSYKFKKIKTNYYLWEDVKQKNEIKKNESIGNT